MNANQCCRFLRPYAAQPLLTRRPVYLRFYQLAQQDAQLRCHRRGVATASQGDNGQRKRPRQDSAQETPGDRSTAIALRIKELSEANSLTYPRYEHPRGEVAEMTVESFVEKFGHVEKDQLLNDHSRIHLCGRILSIRRVGSRLVFLDVLQGSHRTQILCNHNAAGMASVSTDDFKQHFRLLKRGDFVAVQGCARRSTAGELSLQAAHLPRLLSPSLVPLPSSLVDEDTRIQNRHMDLLVNQPTVDTLRLRSHIISRTRRFLEDKGFVEVQTPILAENAGGAVARPFSTTSSEFASKELALRIAPELWLKRLVVGGLDRVFELGPAFRNEGLDATHNPEFTMCEFYAAYWSLDTLIKQTEDLLARLAESCAEIIDHHTTSLPPVDVATYAGPFRRFEFVPTLEKALGFSLPDLASDTALEELTSLLASRGAEGVGLQSRAQTLPKLLDRLAATHIEPFSQSSPIFITHHPACMSPLAKGFTCPATGQAVSARAELFVAGRELANMYEEENDPFEQRRKFAQQAASQRAPAGGTDGTDGDGAAPVVDESYLAALDCGLPPTGGWGCGVDRLVMLFSGAKRISDCLSFGSLRNVVGLSAGSRKKES